MRSALKTRHCVLTLAYTCTNRESWCFQSGKRRVCVTERGRYCKERETEPAKRTVGQEPDCVWILSLLKQKGKLLLLTGAYMPNTCMCVWIRAYIYIYILELLFSSEQLVAAFTVCFGAWMCSPQCQGEAVPRLLESVWSYMRICVRERKRMGGSRCGGPGGIGGLCKKIMGFLQKERKKRCGCLVEAGAGECGQPAVERSCRQGQRIRFLARMPKLNIHGLLWCF